MAVHKLENGATVILMVRGEYGTYVLCVRTKGAIAGHPVPGWGARPEYVTWKMDANGEPDQGNYFDTFEKAIAGLMFRAQGNRPIEPVFPSWRPVD